MSKCLIMTLGTGENVESGLAKSLATLNPDSVYFLGSNQSAELKDRLARTAPSFAPRFKPLRLLKDENDFDSCAEESRRLILDLLAEGTQLKDIDVDFTSGTKAMSAGLASVAALFEVGRMAYVSGQRDERTGKALSGTEKIIIVFPTLAGIAFKRRQLAVFFNSGLFEAGISVSEAILSSCALPSIAEEFSNWKTLFRVYALWDRFNHVEANQLLKTIPLAFLEDLSLDLSLNKEILNKIATKLNQIKSPRDSTDRDPAERLALKFNPEILADLLENAARRATEGRFDDAVARLYRAAEMIAQIALGAMGKDTSCLQKDQIPMNAQILFPELDASGKAISVGLDRSFNLLLALGDVRAELYLGNRKFKSLLQARNASILAHGIISVASDVFQTMKTEIYNLAFAFVPRLDRDRLLEKARFPIIGLTL